ncbi:MAG TPA: potassium transporter TrkG [Methanomicrobiales archaeon]|nr:potassium transporter TrkG [Methanomicrobiales archaeon]
MERTEYFSILAGEMGVIFRLLGLVTWIPLVIVPLTGEWGMLLPMATVPVAFLVLGRVLAMRHPASGEARLSIVLGAVAIVWFAAAAIGALPFALGAGMRYTDSLFEAMSGWTCTGLTLISVPETMPATLLFWRSFMQWLGGIGMVAFTISVLARSSLTNARCVRPEAETAPFIPGLISTGKEMWQIYVLLTLGSLLLILLTGVPLWDAVNLAMSGISTGGFTLHAAGIEFYQNAALEFALVPVMLAGSLPFMIYYVLYTRKKWTLLRDSQARLIGGLVVVGTVSILIDLTYLTGEEPLTAFRHALFMSVSAITTTGFQDVPLQLWASVSVILLIILMAVGGASGSASGGIKAYRVLLGYHGIIWWLKRIFVSPKIVVPFEYQGQVIANSVAENEVRNNMLVIILYFLTVSVATVVVLHFSTIFFESTAVIFDIVSAMSNVGITTGFVSPEMPYVVKWVFILVMWVGRLEIVPVLVVILELANRSLGDDTAQIAEIPSRAEGRAAPGKAAAEEGPAVPPEDAWKAGVLAGTDVRPEVFEAVFTTAVEISREGREGKPIGTAFIIGDSPAVLARSKQLVLNPFEGHDPAKRLITIPSNVENVKEFALLDGVFIVSGEGVIEAAGRYITVDTSTVRIPMGLGTRHASVAGITRATNSVGIVVSQSGGRISVFRGGVMVKQFSTL